MVVALKKSKQAASRTIDRREIALSSLDRIMFPADGITKGDIVDYYDRIAPRILPFLRGRPLVLERFPEGIDKGGFFQKQVGAHFPDWVRRARVKKEGGWQSLAVCEDRATLLYLANQGALVLHPWLSCAGTIRRPDLFVLDLDPSSEDFTQVRRAAKLCRALFDELRLPVFLKTSGSRGLHLVVPLDGKADFDAVRAAASQMACVLAARHPKVLTNEQRKAKRGNRVYLDVARNAYAQTAVAAYSVRALPGAPVSAPIAWEELDRRALHARTFTIRNVFDQDDAWKGWRKKACSIAALAKKGHGRDEPGRARGSSITAR